MDLLARVRTRHISLMRKTLDTLGNILKQANAESLTTLRDGDDGWTALEVLCHLRDFDRIFFERMRRIVNEISPVLTKYDHLQMAIERAYNQDDAHSVYYQLVNSREQMISFLEHLTETQWERTGTHPERDYPFSLTDAVMQVGHHDADHIEQMTRILAQQ